MKSVLLTLSVMLVVALSCGAVQAEEAKSLQIEGSTTVGPIGDAFAAAFQKMHPDLAITVNKAGSGTGAAALSEGRCQIAMMSRFMKDKEFKTALSNEVYPVAHAIAIDGVCVVVNPQNSVSELTRDQVKDIYAGKYTNWKELGGPDLEIVPISRDTASGTYEVFNEKVMQKEKMGSHVQKLSANPQVHGRVKTTVGAVGYVGFGFVDNAVKALQIDGVKPTRDTIARGVYPISRPLFLFTNGYPEMGSLEHAFCTFHLTEQGQDIIEDKKFVPVTNY